MAGDWVAIRSSLISSPKLIKIARLLDTDPFHDWAIEGRAKALQESNATVVTLSHAAIKGVTLSLLTVVWSYAREHGKYAGDDLELDHIGVEDVDEIAGGAPGLGAAMAAVDWLRSGEGGVIFPNFREFNPQTDAERQKRYREKKKQQSNGAVTTPSQRRDDKVTPTQHNTTGQDTTQQEKEAPSSKSASSPPPPDSPVFIELELNDKTLHQVTEADVAEYVALYPAVDVQQQLRNMRGWLHDNPKRRKTRDGIRRFIGTWLKKEQDKGGPPPRTPGPGDGSNQAAGKIGRAMAAIGELP